MQNDSHHLQLLRAIKGKLFLFIGPLIIWAGLTTVGHAQTFNVNSTADTPLSGGMCTGSGTCTLRAAIQKANQSANTTDAQGTVQPDVINLPANTYTLTIGGIDENQAATGDLDITESVNIIGAGSGSTVIDGNNLDRVFHIVQTGIAVVISNVTIENGHLDGGLGGGLFNNGGTVSIVDSVITNNSLTDSSTSPIVSAGGGLFSSGTLNLNGVTLSNNTVDVNHFNTTGGGGGGGVYSTGVLRLENSIVDGNQVINDDKGENNGGGGVQTTGATGSGSNTTHTVIVRSTITNNVAPLGGGVRNLFGRVDMDLTEVDGNSAELSGGGVQNQDGSMSILRSTIRNNIAKQTGGGVDNLAALDINESFIYQNKSIGLNAGAGGAGGGIFNGSAGALNLINTTVTANVGRAGGGVYNHKEFTATNATIYDNSLIDAGGAPKASPGTEVFACGSGDVITTTISNCNTDIADSNGNLIIHTNFINTIVGNSTYTDNCNGDVADLVVSKGHNIETGVNSCGFNQSGDHPNASSSAIFATAAPQYNGGDLASLLTFAILDNSGDPARNGGDFTHCPATDQRGFDRNDLNDDKCDIGAYEVSTTKISDSVLDLALDITYGVAAPLNGTVQTTITYAVVNKGPLQGTSVKLTGSIPALPWLKITSLDNRCSQTDTGFVCSGLTVDAYDSLNIFVAVLATQAGKFTVGGEVTSAEADNYRPDNIKTVTIDIPTVAGSSVSGNNFAGSSGGGAVDWLSLAVLFPIVTGRLRRRNGSE